MGVGLVGSLAVVAGPKNALEIGIYQSQRLRLLSKVGRARGCNDPRWVGATLFVEDL